MKKKQIVEAAYGIVAVFLFVLCYNKHIMPQLIWAVDKSAEKDGQTEMIDNPAEDGDRKGNAELSGILSGDGTDTENNTGDLPGTETPPENDGAGENQGQRTDARIKIENSAYEQYDNTSYDWWFRRMEGHLPSGSGEEGVSIAEYGGYYRDTNCPEDEKVIYLTFDCGYENGYTPAILDALKAADVKAMFFVTKNFITRNPDYVKRMKEEGHLVGNHTARHLASSGLTPEELEAELLEVEQAMRDCTGYEMDRFFRPPLGEYSERVLRVAQDMGYKTIFWSIAYLDYEEDAPPGKAYVVQHFQKYHHSGAIPLIHNTCVSNAEALPEVLEYLRAEGYQFKRLDELK